MEQPRDLATKRLQKRIRNVLGFFGIEGEIGIASPARSIEEHTQIALAKNYSTIVAVGSDKLVNKIASLLRGKDRVLGVIPLSASEYLSDLVGVQTIEEACQSLKYRKIQVLNLSYLAPSKYFLTKAILKFGKPMTVDINIDGNNLQTAVTQLEIFSAALDPSGYQSIFFNNENDGPNILIRSLYYLFGKPLKDIYSSKLRGKKAFINTPEPVPVIIDGEIVAKTPISLQTAAKCLKIITSRARIVKDKK